MAVKTHVVVVQNGKLLLVETKRAARELDKKRGRKPFAAFATTEIIMRTDPVCDMFFQLKS